MSVFFVILAIIIPIAFALLLGVLAGRTGIVKPEYSGVFFALALDFCLPSLLFVTTAGMTVAQLANWRFYLGIALGLLVIYCLVLVLSLVVFRKSLQASSLQALNSAFPNMAAMACHSSPRFLAHRRLSPLSSGILSPVSSCCRSPWSCWRPEGSTRLGRQQARYFGHLW